MQITIIELILLTGILISLVFAILSYLKTTKLILNYRSLTKGVRGRNLEELLKQHLSRIDSCDKRVEQVNANLQDFVKISRKHFQKIGFKRFNPFSQTGGDQSFVLILLDAEDNGIILSSLHQRDVTRVYAKYIDHGESKNKLFDEEKEVLSQTIRS